MLIRFALQPDLDTLMSTSAIPLSLYKKWKGHGDFDRDRYSELFRKYEGDKHAYRIYLPITGKPDVAKKVVVPQQIIDALAAKGYVADDYRAGIAVDSKLGKRKIKIGKLLSDNPELLKQFNRDEQRSASRVSKSDLMVVISRHPYDIAGMSTGRGWRSCTNLEDGVNKHYVIKDVKHGTLIAYLVKADDKNIEKPLARVRLYRFERKVVKAKAPKVVKEVGAKGAKPPEPVAAPVAANDFVLMREPRIYGTPSPQFTAVIDKWLDTVNEGRADGLYCVNKNVHTDDAHDQVELMSDTSILIAKIKANKVPNLRDTRIRLSEDKKSDVLEAVMEKLRAIKPIGKNADLDISSCSTIVNNITGLLRVCLPINKCAEIVNELMAHKSFVYAMNSDDELLGIDLLATAWTLGSPLAPLVKFLHDYSLELPETLKEMQYLPPDLSAEELLFSFYMATRKTLSRVWEYEGDFMYGCFDNTIAITPEVQASVKLAFLTDTVDNWLQGEDIEGYDATINFVNRIKNLYQSFGRDLTKDKTLLRLLTESYSLDGKALFKTGVFTEQQYHDKVLDDIAEGNIDPLEALEGYEDDPALQRSIVDMLVEATDGRTDYLEDKTFVDLITKEDFDKILQTSLKRGNDIDVFEMVGLLKYPKLESHRYITPQVVEKNFIKRIFSYTSAADIAKLKKLVPAPQGSFLEQVYKLKVPK